MVNSNGEGDMRRIEWLDFMAVHNDARDAGRQALLEALNRFADTGQGRDQAVALQYIDELIKVARREFAVEDGDMAAAGYPLALWHAHRHQHLLELLINWRERMHDHWRCGMGANFFLSFAPPLFRHFGDDDRRFARFKIDNTRDWRLAA